MPNGIDATVDPMKSRPLEPSPDCTPPDAGGEQLMPSHYPVLHLRQLSEHPIHVATGRSQWTSFTLGPREVLNVKLFRGAGSNRGLHRHLSRRLAHRHARVAR